MKSNRLWNETRDLDDMNESIEVKRRGEKSRERVPSMAFVLLNSNFREREREREGVGGVCCCFSVFIKE